MEAFISLIQEKTNVSFLQKFSSMLSLKYTSFWKHFEKNWQKAAIIFYAHVGLHVTFEGINNFSSGTKQITARVISLTDRMIYLYMKEVIFKHFFGK